MFSGHDETLGVDDALEYAERVVQPAVALVVAEERGVECLAPARAVLRPHGPPAEPEEQQRAVLQAHASVAVRQHRGVAPPLRVVHPTHLALYSCACADGAVAIAVAPSLLAAEGLNQ